jgi:hypothetical protein
MIGCTVSSNTASVRGGGLFQGTAANSIIYFNTAPSEANIGLATATLRNCCTIPFVPGYVGPGAGDFTNAPRFVDQFGGNFRLQTNSPCIGTGNNGNVSTSTDLDGRPRIVGGTVDVGAYEFQGVGFDEFIAWLQSFGFPTDGSADFSDPDHDGMNNWQEWRSGTDPLDFASALRMSAPVVNSSGVLLKWQSISGVTYYLMRSTTLSPQPLFLDLQSNLVGNAGETTFVDTNPPTSSLTLYRVGVQ